MNIEIKQNKTGAELALEAQIKALLDQPAAGRVSLAREAGRDVFVRSGLPNRRVEEWKYTDLRGQLKDIYEPVSAAIGLTSKALDELLGSFAALKARRIVLNNFELDQNLSDLNGLGEEIEISTLLDALENPPAWLPEDAFGVPGDDGMTALNQALMAGGLMINITGTLTTPLMIVHLTGTHDGQPGAVYTNSRINVASGAEATIIELFVSADQAAIQHHCVTTVSVEQGAKLSHLRHQALNAHALQLAGLTADLADEAEYHSVQFSTGAALARNQARVKFNGARAHAAFHAGIMLSADQHNDTTLVVDHDVAEATSTELFKAVLEDKSRGVFQGKITVAPDAQKTDARMMAQALLLSEQAEFDAKPELKIYADDVQCAHGATARALDDDMMFYLRSRGVPEHDARALLTEAFIAEVFDGIADQAVRDAFIESADRWRAKGGGDG